MGGLETGVWRPKVSGNGCLQTLWVLRHPSEDKICPKTLEVISHMF